MGLGTKNRLKQTADFCKEHLRVKHSGDRVLVEEFICEIEGSGRAQDLAQWGQFTDVRRGIDDMMQRLDERFEKWLQGEV